MALLFVNACMREASRTERLARNWLAEYGGDVVELRVGELDVQPLDPERLVRYSAAVSSESYDDALFDYAKQFAQADEILIAAPFWNYGVPAKLHAYLELVCSQGVTFDLDSTGAYVSLCRARKLTFITTAGGIMPPAGDDHAFGYLQTLAREFWHIPEIHRIYEDATDA